MKKQFDLFLILGILIFLGLIWYFKMIAAYVLIAVILSLIGQPVLRFFNRLKISRFQIPNVLSVILTMLSLLLGSIALITLTIPFFIKEVSIITSIDPKQVIILLEKPLNNLEILFRNINQNQELSLETYVKEKLIAIFDLAQIRVILNALMQFTGEIFVALFAILFMTFFFLKDENLLYNTFMLLIPDQHHEKVNSILSSSRKLLTRYFLGIIIQVLLIVVLLFIGLSILGIKNALTIALLAGALNIIPYIGPLIGFALGLIIALSTNLEMNDVAAFPFIFAKVGIIFLIIQVLDNLIFQPLIYSNTVKAHPLEIFLVILIAGSTTGVIGMIVAIPIYTIFRVFARAFFSNFKIIKKLTENIDQ